MKRDTLVSKEVYCFHAKKFILGSQVSKVSFKALVSTFSFSLYILTVLWHFKKGVFFTFIIMFHKCLPESIISTVLMSRYSENVLLSKIQYAKS